MSGPMASDENGGGNSNDSGSDDSAAVVAAAAAAAERVVMIAFKMEVTDDDETGDVAAAAGPSAERQADVLLEGMVQTTPSPPFSDGTEGKTYSILFSCSIGTYIIGSHGCICIFSTRTHNNIMVHITIIMTCDTRHSNNVW